MMTEQKKQKKSAADATEAVAEAADAAVGAAAAIGDAARASAASNALKFRIWEAIIGGLVAAFLGYINLQTLLATNVAISSSKSTAEKVEANAAEVKQVKETTLSTHALVNSGSLVDLELHLVTARRLAQMSNDPRDAAVVELIERKIFDHKEKMIKEEAATKQSKAEAREDAKDAKK